MYSIPVKLSLLLLLLLVWCYYVIPLKELRKFPHFSWLQLWVFLP